MSSENGVYTLIPSKQPDQVFQLQDQASHVVNNPVWQQLQQIRRQENEWQRNQSVNTAVIPGTVNERVLTALNGQERQRDENLRNSSIEMRHSFRNAQPLQLMSIENVTQGMYSHYPDAGILAPKKKTEEQIQKERDIEKSNLQLRLLEVENNRQQYYELLEKDEEKEKPEVIVDADEKKEVKTPLDLSKEKYEYSQKQAVEEWLKFNEENLRQDVRRCMRILYPQDPLAQSREEEAVWREVANWQVGSNFNENVQLKITQVYKVVNATRGFASKKNDPAVQLYKGLSSIVETVADARILDDKTEISNEQGKIIEDQALQGKTLAEIEFKLNAKVKVTSLDSADQSMVALPPNINHHRCTVVEVLEPGIYPKLLASEKVKGNFETAEAKVRCNVAGNLQDALIEVPYEKVAQDFELSRKIYEQAISNSEPGLIHHYKEQYEQMQRKVFQEWYQRNKDSLKKTLGSVVDTLYPKESITFEEKVDKDGNIPGMHSLNEVVRKEIDRSLSEEAWVQIPVSEAAQRLASNIHGQVVRVRSEPIVSEALRGNSEKLWMMFKKQLEYVTGGEIIADQLYGRNLAAIEADGIPIHMPDQVFTPDNQPAVPGRCIVVQVEPGIISTNSQSVIPFDNIPPVVKCNYREEDMPAEELAAYEDEFLDARDTYADTVTPAEKQTINLWNEKRFAEIFDKLESTDSDNALILQEALVHHYKKLAEHKGVVYPEYAEDNGYLLYSPPLELSINELVPPAELERVMVDIIDDLSKGIDSGIASYRRFPVEEVIRAYGIEALATTSRPPSDELIMAALIINHDYPVITKKVLSKLKSEYPESVQAYNTVFGEREMHGIQDVVRIFNIEVKNAVVLIQHAVGQHASPLPTTVELSFARSKAAQTILRDYEPYFKLGEDITSKDLLASISLHETMELNRLSLINQLQHKIRKAYTF